MFCDFCQPCNYNDHDWHCCYCYVAIVKHSLQYIVHVTYLISQCIATCLSQLFPLTQILFYDMHYCEVTFYSVRMSLVSTYNISMIICILMCDVLLFFYYVCRYFKIGKGHRLSWSALWVLIMLLSTDVLNTSISILNCPSLTDSNGNNNLVRMCKYLCLYVYTVSSYRRM